MGFWVKNSRGQREKTNLEPMGTGHPSPSVGPRVAHASRFRSTFARPACLFPVLPSAWQSILTKILTASRPSSCARASPFGVKWLHPLGSPPQLGQSTARTVPPQECPQSLHSVSSSDLVSITVSRRQSSTGGVGRQRAFRAFLGPNLSFWCKRRKAFL